jgi:hypothetical protein
MSGESLLERYNYSEFVPVKFAPWMRFDESPPLGELAPDFLLWDLDENQIYLHDVIKENIYTIVEFGSFT